MPLELLSVELFLPVESDDEVVDEEVDSVDFEPESDEVDALVEFPFLELAPDP
ncbi:MAG: hypothetical protein O3B95_03395 [Chloroflexi bacterium]|nr:hypothetical protein [Chloroflexota bacterium]